MSFYVAAPPPGEDAVHPVDEVLPPVKLGIYGAQHVLAFCAGAVEIAKIANLRLFDLVHEDPPPPRPPGLGEEPRFEVVAPGDDGSGVAPAEA